MTDTPTTFVPADLDCTDFANIEPLMRQLIDRPIRSATELEQWLADQSLLFAHIYETGSRLNIDYACHTDDESKEKAYLHFVENVRPKIQPLAFALQKKYVESPHREGLAGPRYAVLDRQWRTDVEIYRDENVPIETRLAKLNTEYDKLCGAMTVDFQGKTHTLQQMARYLEETDRGVREQAWSHAADRRLADREKIDAVFDQMIAKRQAIAKNAGFDDFRAYTWRQWYRFDYTPDDCRRFADAVAEVCMPLVIELDVQRKRKLGLDTLRPWDTAVDPLGRSPLCPFDPGNVQDFVGRTRTVFERVSPPLADQFATMKLGEHLDLDSRKGKRPGGFQSSLELSRRPFIFMNAAGLQRDVETLLHEGGHAFHYMASCARRAAGVSRMRRWNSAKWRACRWNCSAPITSRCSIPRTRRARAKRRACSKRSLGHLFPWIATIDAFQHWLYTHPDHSREQRTAWLAILNRFSSDRDRLDRADEARQAMWQRQLHLFHAPFYYIEYGIAQLGALQVWQNYRARSESVAGETAECLHPWRHAAAARVV